MPSKSARYQVWIDRGGTFTDCIGVDPNNRTMRVAKVLSTDDAPLVGIRTLLELPPEAPMPPIDLRMGTTLATNALLERRGARTALVITRGFADLLRIGDQTRPDLFALSIARPEPLHEAVVETDARLSPDGDVLAEPDLAALRVALAELRARGILRRINATSPKWPMFTHHSAKSRLARPFGPRGGGSAHVTNVCASTASLPAPSALTLALRTSQPKLPALSRFLL